MNIFKKVKFSCSFEMNVKFGKYEFSFLKNGNKTKKK